MVGFSPLASAPLAASGDEPIVVDLDAGAYVIAGQPIGALSTGAYVIAGHPLDIVVGLNPSQIYGRVPVVIAEVTQPRCALRFGVGACTATGTPKCYNT